MRHDVLQHPISAPTVPRRAGVQEGGALHGVYLNAAGQGTVVAQLQHVDDVVPEMLPIPNGTKPIIISNC